MLIICSYCKKQLINGVWLVTLPPPGSALVSHGMCPECYKTQIEELDRKEEEERNGRLQN